MSESTHLSRSVTQLVRDAMTAEANETRLTLLAEAQMLDAALAGARDGRDRLKVERDRLREAVRDLTIAAQRYKNTTQPPWHVVLGKAIALGALLPDDQAAPLEPTTTEGKR